MSWVRPFAGLGALVARGISEFFALVKASCALCVINKKIKKETGEVLCR